MGQGLTEELIEARLKLILEILMRSKRKKFDGSDAANIYSEFIIHLFVGELVLGKFRSVEIYQRFCWYVVKVMTFHILPIFPKLEYTAVSLFIFFSRTMLAAVGENSNGNKSLEEQDENKSQEEDVSTFFSIEYLAEGYQGNIFNQVDDLETTEISLKPVLIARSWCSLSAISHLVLMVINLGGETDRGFHVEQAILDMLRVAHADTAQGYPFGFKLTELQKRLHEIFKVDKVDEKSIAQLRFYCYITGAAWHYSSKKEREEYAKQLDLSDFFAVAYQFARIVAGTFCRESVTIIAFLYGMTRIEYIKQG